MAFDGTESPEIVPNGISEGAERAFQAVSDFIERGGGFRESYGPPDLRNQRAVAQMTGRVGEIYFVAFAEGGPIKIGFTSNFEYRLQHLQTSCPYELTVLARVEGTTADERQMHRQFADHQIRGEWFEPHADILAEIERLAALQRER